MCFAPRLHSPHHHQQQPRPPLCLSVTLPDAKGVGLSRIAGHRATEVPERAKHLGYALCMHVRRYANASV